MKINAEAVTIARMARQYTQTKLAEKISVSQGLISKLEMGLIGEPDRDIVKSLSQELEFPVEFFYEEMKLLDPGIKYLRARKSLSKKKINKIDSRLSIVTNTLKKLLRNVDFPKNNIPELDINEYESAEQAALSLRDFWNVPRGPIKNLTGLIEDNGGLVIQWDFETKKLDGLTFTLSNLPPVVFINKQMTGDRYRFTLAHELAHLVLHMSTPYSSEQDKEADVFASEFMMPTSEIKESLYNLDFETLASLKLYWKMSMQSILYKAKSLNVLTSNQYRYWQMKFSSAGYRKREPSSTDFPVEKSELLDELIQVYKEELDYSLEELLTAVNLNENDFKEWFLGIDNKRLRLIK
jgi:Zn-dependent peptidase ImmA (M78 family)/DNA-binding XRE family transcriptional regulator